MKLLLHAHRNESFLRRLWQWLVRCFTFNGAFKRKHYGDPNNWRRYRAFHVPSLNQSRVRILSVSLSLLPFFTFFKGDNPHRLAAIKELEDSMPKSLLAENASWYLAWKASGFDQEIRVPYFSQRDNKSNEGFRECFSSSVAMVASFYEKVKSDDEYNLKRSYFGDTTQVEAQLRTLKSFGLQAEFRRNGNTKLIEHELENGRPVLVGYLSDGNMLQGEPPMCSANGCGHWLVITGYRGKNSSDPQWVVNDPNGFPMLEEGGHHWDYSGKNAVISQSLFKPRWEADGPNTGWVILVRE